MKKSGKDFIKKIYEESCNLDLCKTQNEFSQKICGKSPKWYSVISAENRNPSVGSLFFIASRVGQIARSERSRNLKRSIMNIQSLVMRELSNKTFENV